MESGWPVSGSREPVAVRSVSVEEARNDSADEIWRGLLDIMALMFDACERHRTFSGSAMVLRVGGDMVEHG
jgi:hypothetical protein